MKTRIRDFREIEKDRVSGLGEHRIEGFCELYSYISGIVVLRTKI